MIYFIKRWIDKFFNWLGYEPIIKQKIDSGLVLWDDKWDDRDNRDDSIIPWVSITKIVVPTQYDKEQLLLGFEYIHNLPHIDTDIMSVNLIAHIYTHPDLIEISDDNQK